MSTALPFLEILRDGFHAWWSLAGAQRCFFSVCGIEFEICPKKGDGLNDKLNYTFPGGASMDHGLYFVNTRCLMKCQSDFLVGHLDLTIFKFV